MRDGKYLTLGWARYLDSLNQNDECWIYFYGQHAFKPGVYVKGYISDIDRAKGEVRLRVRHSDVEQPLTDSATTRRIAQAVSVRYRQVFLWPDDWKLSPDCGPKACRERLCNDCHAWQSIPVIRAAELQPPPGTGDTAVVPAYWIIPRRCYIHREYKRAADWTVRISHMFDEFKLGARDYAFPLACGIFTALRASHDVEFDAIVPIPLSPDKLEAGELHRTKLLAQELSGLLGGIPVREYLSLSQPISKRRMLADGRSVHEFRFRYLAALRVHKDITRVRRVLLIDDVITRGTTITCAIHRLSEAHPAVEVVVASAGQMIVKDAVLNEDGFTA
jgi:predicted amidophosphoribosyltransferase